MLERRTLQPQAEHDRAVTVVAADADPLARVGLRALLEQTSDWQWLGHIEEARAVLLTVSRLRPDVVLLDSAWDCDSTLVQALYTHFPQLSVVILTRPRHQRTQDYQRNARNAGAVATIARDERPAELVSQLQRAVADTPVPSAYAG